MKDEIKEILDIERYRNKDGYAENINLLPSEIVAIKDYITNLQEEINILTAESTEWESKFYDLQEEYEKLLKKSYSDNVRITKAIEYIKEQTKGYQDDFDRVDEESWLYDLKITLNILQGEDNE